jgi:3-hydroxybutyryl-CoA dehydrogenase
MRCFVLSDDDQWKDLFASALAVEVIKVSRDECIPGNAGVLFDLRPEAWDLDLYRAFPQNPLFISAVQDTLKEHQAPGHVVRLNGWAGMMEKPLLECSGDLAIRDRAEEILDRLNKKVEWVPDLPGMVSPRVISMIINEAWFTWEEGVATKEDIDIAMKLGTNYPYGPFAWGTMIGLDKIVSLLKKLSAGNPRYEVAASLLKETVK